MKYEEMQDLKTQDVMQYLLKDVDVEDFKRVTSKTTIDRLKKDCNVIQVKMFEALKNENMGTYNNLQKALVNNINAIKSLETDYTTVYSEYETKENPVTGKVNKQVAIWEQNSDGEIRNRKSWDVKESADSIGLTAETIKGNIVGDESDELYTTLVKLIKDTIGEVCSTQSAKNDKFKDFEENLKSVIENFSIDGKIIISTSEAIRGVGKTTFLVKQIIENDGIYIGKDKKANEYAKKIANEMFNKTITTAYLTLDDLEDKGLKKFYYHKTLYIDEGVDLTKIDLNKNKYVAFKYIPLNSL